jgi:hypothetical protein
METTITIVESNVEIREDDHLLSDLEKLSDAELAQVGGGAGLFVL